MMTTLKLTVVAAMLVLGAAGTAAAEPKTTSAPKKADAVKYETEKEHAAHLDANKDGKISKAERKAAKRHKVLKAGSPKRR